MQSVAGCRPGPGRAREGLSDSFSASSPAAKGAFMQILFSRCCGIDVHKDSVTACVLIYTEGQEPEVRKQEFPAHFKSLGNLRFWLMAQKVTHVAMESTCVYWKPVWQALEGHFELILANPFQIKTVPGRKMDDRDSRVAGARPHPAQLRTAPGASRSARSDTLSSQAGPGAQPCA